MSNGRQAQASMITLGHNANYFEFVDAQFMALAAREGLTCMRGLNWVTEFTDIASLGDALCSAKYDFNGAHCVLARLPTGIAMLVIQQSRFIARLAAESEKALDQTEAWLRRTGGRARSRAPRGSSRVLDRGSRRRGQSDLLEAAGADVVRRRANYASETREQLGSMVEAFRPGHGGRLILWSGPPGTGKTYALRALAWEWRSWCSIHYVVDPEIMFGSNGQYLTQMVMRPEPQQRWRLIVLEDTGELLAADAKSRTGQGLSRLLNVVDGILGQGFPSLVLVTTNEEMGALHPAIARPGRCARRIKFEPLSQLEADAWLADRGVDSNNRGARTLAELYAVAEGFAVREPQRATVGFAA